MWTGHITILAMISTTVGLAVVSFAILMMNVEKQVYQKKALKSTTSVQLNQTSNSKDFGDVYRMVLSTNGKVLESNVRALEDENKLTEILDKL